MGIDATAPCFGPSDFKVTNGTFYGFNGTNTTDTMEPGVDYEAPVREECFFVVIRQGWAARNGLQGTCAYISDWSPYTGIELTRISGSNATELPFTAVEYVGASGGVNEFIVRDVQNITFAASGTTANGTAVAGVVDDDKVVTLVVGNELSSNIEESFALSSWDSGNQRPVITRGSDNGGAGSTDTVTVAVIEFTGANWTTSDVTVTPSSNYTVENATISISDVAKTFVFTEVAANGVPSSTLSDHDLQHTVEVTSTTNVAVGVLNSAQATEMSVRVVMLESSDANANVEWVTGNWTSSTNPNLTTTSISDPYNCAIGFWASADAGSEQTSINGLYVVGYEFSLDSATQWSWSTDTSTATTIDYSAQIQRWPGAGLTTDFKVQRGWAYIEGASNTATLTAGRHYAAPASSTSAFARIVMYGWAGPVNQNAANVSGPSGQTSPGGRNVSLTYGTDITTSFTITSDDNQSQRFRFMWEIIEYVGEGSGGNEMVVRDVGEITISSTNTTADSGSVGTIVDDNDAMVICTGYDTTGTGYFNGGPIFFTKLEWVGGGTDVVRATRGGTSSDVSVSYALVEWTGANWLVFHDEQNPASAGTQALTHGETTVRDQTTIFDTTAYTGSGTVNAEEDYSYRVWISSTTQWTMWRGAATDSDDIVIRVAMLENTDGSNPMDVERSAAVQTAGGTQTFSTSISANDLASTFLPSYTTFRMYGTVTQNSTGTSVSNANVMIGTPGAGANVACLYQTTTLDTQHNLTVIRMPGAIVDNSAAGGSGKGGVGKGPGKGGGRGGGNKKNRSPRLRATLIDTAPEVY